MGGIGAKRGDVVVTDAGVVPPAVDEHHDVVAAGRLPHTPPIWTTRARS